MARMRSFDPASFKDIAANSQLNDAVGAAWSAIGKPIHIVEAIAKRGDQFGKPEVAKELARRLFDAGIMVAETSYLSHPQLEHIQERANRAEAARLKAAAKKAAEQRRSNQAPEAPGPNSPAKGNS